jgi:hypothetical protein
MKNNCMLPTVLRIEAGQTIVFTNYDSAAHTVTGVGGGTGEGWGTFEELTLDEKVQHRFDADGTYVYYCLLHAGMVGAIVVGDGISDADIDASVSRIGGSGAPAPAASTATSDGGDHLSAWRTAGIAAAALAAGVCVTAVALRSRRQA